MSLDEIRDIGHVRELPPHQVLNLAASLFVVRNELKEYDRVDFKERGINLSGEGLVFYDMRKAPLDSAEIRKLESYLYIDIPSLQVINPNASLCYFSTSSVSTESLIMLTWRDGERGEFCLTEKILEKIDSLHEFYRDTFMN